MWRIQPAGLRLLSYVVIAYMCLAFAWWSILLYTKNKDAYHAKVDTLRLVMIAEKSYQNESHFQSSAPYQHLTRQYNRQEWMIFGEAALFMISIIVGVWLIHNSYNHLIRTANEKRNFLLSITHELKSPIASARLGLETIQRRHLDRDLTERISINAQHDLDRLKNLVDNLLLAAKIESNYEPFYVMEDVHAIVDEYLEKVKTIYPGVTFDRVFEAKDSMIEIDRTGFISIVSNLVENAIKYSPQEKYVRIHTVSDSEEFHLSVADLGIGIAESEKAHIFKSFYRIGAEDTRKTKGTGLGLYIIDQLTKAHGGRVIVRDNEPNGSIFKVSLPRQQQK